ncbi:Putative transposase [Legionella sainthelensi]|uniref:hypothetical protein n=1 Tax=Legionella sainthelensi TaxID=28087 RepID=UPI000E2018A2|nr:hypothetical protein [Legionella sainthelensi]VEB38791.1 Putative transposase [Legionella sainthelensi]
MGNLRLSYHQSMLALQEYFMTMPFHCQGFFQSLIGFPIAAYIQSFIASRRGTEFYGLGLPLLRKVSDILLYEDLM